MARKKTIKIHSAEIFEISPAELREDPRNAKKHPEQQLKLLQETIADLGFTYPVIIDEDYQIISGHARVTVAKRLGMEVVPVMVAKGWTEEMRARYSVLDNKITELGTWNDDMLKETFQFLESKGVDLNLTGFNDGEVEKLLGLESLIPKTEGFTGQVESPVTTRRGDVWILGQHRLMCGDSLDGLDVARLMAGKTADIIATDPPYLIDYKGDNAASKWSASYDQKSGVKEKPTWDLCSSPDDALKFFTDFMLLAKLHVKQNASWWIWHMGSRARELEQAFDSCGLIWHQTIIWVKNQPVLGRQEFMNQFETCAFGWLRGKKPVKVSKATKSTIWKMPDPLAEAKARVEIDGATVESQSDVLEVDSASYKDRGLHPTQKPKELFGIAMRHYTKRGALLYEPFSGSGSCLCSAEENKRICYAMDLEPLYVDHAVRRWEDQTGEVAKLEGGKSFGEVRAERFHEDNSEAKVKKSQKKSAE